MPRLQGARRARHQRGAVHGKYSTKSDSKLKDLGLTKYVKTSDGSYARTVGGGGPKMIRKPDDD